MLEPINDMYRLVNENAKKNLIFLTEKYSVKKYLDTLNVNNMDDKYKKNYKDFYVITGQMISNEKWLNEYFDILRSKKINDNSIKPCIDDLFGIVKHLEDIPCNSKGKKIQFSFASKLFHTLFDEYPIYDSNVAQFFSFEDIEKIKLSQNKNEDNDSYKKRVREFKYTEYKRRYEFLISEYNRIKERKLLDQAISLFENEITCESKDKDGKKITFKDISYTKKIDFAIWGFIGLVKDGAILNGDIRYGKNYE